MVYLLGEIIKKFLILILLSLSLYAKSIANYISLGYSSASIVNSGNGFNIGWGFNKVSESDFYWGILFDYESVTINNSSVTGFNGDLQVGITPLQKVSIFAVGSALTQSALNTTGYGFGYGIGGNIEIINNIDISIGHKVYAMTNKYQEYDYKTTSINLIYKF